MCGGRSPGPRYEVTSPVPRHQPLAAGSVWVQPGFVSTRLCALRSLVGFLPQEKC